MKAYDNEEASYEKRRSTLVLSSFHFEYTSQTLLLLYSLTPTIRCAITTICCATPNVRCVHDHDQPSLICRSQSLPRRRVVGIVMVPSCRDTVSRV